MPDNMSTGKIVSFDETWISWMRGLPRSLRRDCHTSHRIGLVFGVLARKVRMGSIAVFHGPAHLPFPTTDDRLYGPIGCHLRSADIMAGFDEALADQSPVLKTALENAIALLPDRTSAPAPAPRRRHGRWNIPAPTPKTGGAP